MRDFRPPSTSVVATGGAGPGHADPLGRVARHVVRAAARRASSGAITLAEDGRVRTFGDGEPHACVTVHDHRTYGALVQRGSVGLAQSYIDEWWDCDDLTALIQVLVRNTAAVGHLRDRLGRATSTFSDPVRRLRHRPKAHDRRDIRAHYDIGNDFFDLMLDSTMSYSCGVFEHPDATLEEASVAKLDRICLKLGLSPSDHVVEIGTGWGGFAVHAASHYGCQVTTTTISAEQHEYACKRVADAGLTHRVTVLHDDYRDLGGQYDKLVSIEMIEAVDWRQLDTFFRACARLLRPDGLMALQAITIADQSYERAKNSRDFIKAFVFPGACLPSVEVIARTTARATDLRIIDLEDIGRHYAPTLRHWLANLDAKASEVERLGLEPRFLRMWQLYLTYCEAAFLERHVSDVQVILAKPAWRAPLLVR